MINPSFWKGRRIFLTGHTGFKGGWLSVWLHHLGAEVTGYALDPPTEPSLFELSGVGALVNDIRGDIRDKEALQRAVAASEPEIVIHMAAQPLVRESYRTPVETWETNVIGTLRLLEAVRQAPSVSAVLIITTDKCYENREWLWPYREEDRLGGYDPYSSSKAAAEIALASWRSSFFSSPESPSIATARAGNVIGGGDYAADRLVPDIIRAIGRGEAVRIRNPHAIRPWQHVLEPLHGYLSLCEHLSSPAGQEFAGAWNFGPSSTDVKPVQWIVEKLTSLASHAPGFTVDEGPHPHEATYLKLDTSKAEALLGWKPAWNLEEALVRIMEWEGASNETKRAVMEKQITVYQEGNK